MQTKKIEGTDRHFIDGIEYEHPDYEKYAPRWKKARDIIEGEDTVKNSANRETYIPRLSGHDNTPQGNADYDSFVEYAELYNATGRTVDAYRGLLNRKLPFIKLPKSVSDLKNAFTIKNESMHTFIEQLEVEVCITNRAGLLIDHPFVKEGSRITKQQAKHMNMSPYASLYTAEAIINWEESRINNRIVTNLVVLKEVELVRNKSYTPEEVITYRVLELDKEGYYRQVVARPEVIEDPMTKKTKTHIEVKETIYPERGGEKMRFIPFYPITAQGITWELNKSVIGDLVSVNIAHLRNTAIHEKALAWTSSPTPVFSGLPDDTQKVRIGSSTAVTIAMGGTAKYLEYEARGLEDIAKALDKKEQQMAILGAKILATEVNGVESGEAAMIHRAGEQGILADIATTIGGAMEEAIRVICDWRKVVYSDKDIVVEITKDYTPAVIDANTILAMGKEVSDGRLSYESYVGAMQRGEIIPPTRTAAEELKLINKTHKGTILSTKENVMYLDKKKSDDILGRGDDIIEKETKKETVVEEPLQGQATAEQETLE